MQTRGRKLFSGQVCRKTNFRSAFRRRARWAARSAPACCPKSVVSFISAPIRHLIQFYPVIGSWTWSDLMARTRSADIAAERFQSHTGCTWYTPWNWTRSTLKARTRSTLQGNYLLSRANLLLPGAPPAKWPQGLRGDPPAEAKRLNITGYGTKTGFREWLIASHLLFRLGEISPKQSEKKLTVR